jgi:hypothetical protein
MSSAYRVSLAVRRPSVRSSQSEYSGKVGVIFLRVNFMVACCHNRIELRCSHFSVSMIIRKPNFWSYYNQDVGKAHHSTR